MAIRSALVAAALGLSPAAAGADLLFGHVSGGGFRPRQDVFSVATLANQVVAGRVATNENNDYRIVLPSGTYRVRFADRSGGVWTALIVSDSEPRRQDIVFARQPK